MTKKIDVATIEMDTPDIPDAECSMLCSEFGYNASGVLHEISTVRNIDLPWSSQSVHQTKLQQNHAQRLVCTSSTSLTNTI